RAVESNLHYRRSATRTRVARKGSARGAACGRELCDGDPDVRRAAAGCGAEHVARSGGHSRATAAAVGGDRFDPAVTWDHAASASVVFVARVGAFRLFFVFFCSSIACSSRDQM
uniref:Uncharacterized protein n=1 Tax=Globisporangium ultimum (strain ATCC 200006 / CBS 805.95 / DAOM BR144) TaxID=431595 RepID=K3WP61_GLOUD